LKPQDTRLLLGTVWDGFAQAAKRGLWSRTRPRQKEQMASGKQRGFSLLEMVVVLAIGLIMAAITFISLQPALKDAHVNTAYNSVLGQVRQARQRAVDNREQYIICFGTDTPHGAATPLGTPTTQSVTMFQWPSGTALSSAVEINAIQLPSDISFQTLSTPAPGIPTSSTTVPDGFGSGNIALAFDQGVTGGVTDQIMFMPDGTARDTTGNVNSGVLYLARTGDLYSSRSISLFGASGRIRGWRLVNKTGTPTWIEQ
jgi:prepilin-type N-terminal cleavage/methylation domain-containing protein